MKTEFDIIAEASIQALDEVAHEAYGIIQLKEHMAGGKDPHHEEKTSLESDAQQFFDKTTKIFAKYKEETKGKIYRKNYQSDYMVTRIIQLLDEGVENFRAGFVIEDIWDLFLNAVTLSFVYLERHKSINLIHKETGLSKLEILKKLECLKQNIFYSCGIHREANIIGGLTKIKYYSRNLSNKAPDRLETIKRLVLRVDPTGNMPKWRVAKIISQEAGVSANTIVNRDFKKLNLYEK